MGAKDVLVIRPAQRWLHSVYSVLIGVLGAQVALVDSLAQIERLAFNRSLLVAQPGTLASRLALVQDSLLIVLDLEREPVVMTQRVLCE